MLQIWIDGACEPTNPGGTASYGVVAKEGFTTIFTKSGIVTRGKGASNNVAEYAALIAALEYLASREFQSATIHSDSQMLVNQMKGDWGVHGGLYLKYYERAVDIIANNKGMWEKLRFQWIPRDVNTEADRLSVDALASVGIGPATHRHGFDYGDET